MAPGETIFITKLYNSLKQMQTIVISHSRQMCGIEAFTVYSERKDLPTPLLPLWRWADTLLQVPKPNIPHCHGELHDIEVHGDLDTRSSYLSSAKECLIQMNACKIPARKIWKGSEQWSVYLRFLGLIVTSFKLADKHKRAHSETA